MEDNYVVSLKEDPFFSEKTNVGHVQIVNDRVIITMSKQGLLGLGQQLIRLAVNDFEDGYHVHIDPCESEYFSQTMGFYSHPESVDLIISCGDFGPIEKYVK